jgi:hypothetical protein
MKVSELEIWGEKPRYLKKSITQGTELEW